jgi:hypothetical protein
MDRWTDRQTDSAVDLLVHAKVSCQQAAGPRTHYLSIYLAASNNKAQNITIINEPLIVTPQRTDIIELMAHYT